MLDVAPGTDIFDRSSWETVRFGDVVRNVNENERDLESAGFERYVGLEHIDPESLHIKRWGLVAEGTSFTRTFRKGQVLFGKRRAYQRKVAVAEWDAICSGDILVFEPKDDRLLPQLLPFIVQSDGFFLHALGTSAGLLSPRTRWNDLSAYEFALPSREEQHWIAELLWGAENSAIRCIRVLESLEQLRESALAQAVNDALEGGRLRVLDSLVEPGRPVTYGILKPGLGVADGIPVIKVKDYPAGTVVVADLLLTDPSIDAEYKRSRLKAGDLLLSIRGTVGRLASVPPDLEGANITQDTARLSIRSGVDAGFVRAMLESKYVQRQIRSAITGNAVKGINIAEVRKLQIPVLCTDAQSKLVADLNLIANGAEATLRQLERTKAVKKAMLTVFLKG